jgi:HEAT repeat protein
MAGKSIPTYMKKMCEMLKDDRSEFQCAAAMVLGELKIKNPFVVKSLGEVLNNGEDHALKEKVLEAFEKIESKESLKYLMPFLFNSDVNETFANRAISIASKLGLDAAKSLKNMLKDADTRARIIINSVFIKMRNLEGLNVVLESLQDEDEAVLDEICNLMQEETKRLSSDEKKLFSTKVEQFLKDKKTTKTRQTLTATIKILGFIGHQDSQATLLGFTTLQNHPHVRSQALRSLKDILVYNETKPEVVKKLLANLDESDFTQIVAPTLDILISVPFQTRMADLVIKQLANPHESVRRFAVKKMRELNSTKVVRVLIEKLTDSDATMRDLAAESLCWLDTARTMILDKILQEDELDPCLLYAKILRPHATKFRKNQIKRLGDRLEELMDEKSPLQDAFIFLLKTAAPDYLYECLLNRGLRFKQKKKYNEVVETLKMLQREGRLADEARYELAVSQLKLSAKDASRTARDSDPCLALFQQLIRDDDAELLENLKKEKSITKEELFYVGSHFMEKLQKERAFGTELLNLIMKKYPRSKVGIASRKQLQEKEL